MTDKQEYKTKGLAYNIKGLNASTKVQQRCKPVLNVASELYIFHSGSWY